MPVAKITQRTIDTLEPGAKEYIVYDSALKGFCIRVMPSGVMSYLIEYRPGDGGRKVRKRRLRFGAVAEFNPEKARAVAKDMLAEVRLGGDPAAKRATARRQMTVSELIDDFLAASAARKIKPLKPNTMKNYKLILKKIVEPALGTRQVGQVTRAAVKQLYESLVADTPYQANRMLDAVRPMFAYAAAEGFVVDSFKNPARGIERKKEEKRKGGLQADQLERLGAALREAETVGLPWVADPDKAASKHAPKKPENRVNKISPHAIAAIRLLIFTGCRMREILGLRWTQVDVKEGLLRLPDSKTGPKDVVLNPKAEDVLAALPRVGRFVIAGKNAGAKNEKTRADLKRPWLAICNRAGLSGVRIHDLRHTHASVGANGGLGLSIIGALLGHKDPTTTAGYVKIDPAPARRASEFIGDKLHAAMAEKPAESQSATVISIRR